MVETNIRLGMTWNVDGHRMEVTKMRPGECQITETWIAEDTMEECEDKVWNKIALDGKYEYAYDPKYEQFANPGFKDYSWWARKYACGADYVRTKN